jgi:hypothetical protein
LFHGLEALKSIVFRANNWSEIVADFVQICSRLQEGELTAIWITPVSLGAAPGEAFTAEFSGRANSCVLHQRAGMMRGALWAGDRAQILAELTPIDPFATFPEPFPRSSRNPWMLA